MARIKIIGGALGTAIQRGDSTIVLGFGESLSIDLAEGETLLIVENEPAKVAAEPVAAAIAAPAPPPAPAYWTLDPTDPSNLPAQALAPSAAAVAPAGPEAAAPDDSPSEAAPAAAMGDPAGDPAPEPADPPSAV